MASGSWQLSDPQVVAEKECIREHFYPLHEGDRNVETSENLVERWGLTGTGEIAFQIFNCLEVVRKPFAAMIIRRSSLPPLLTLVAPITLHSTPV